MPRQRVERNGNLEGASGARTICWSSPSRRIVERARDCRTAMRWSLETNVQGLVVVWRMAMRTGWGNGKEMLRLVGDDAARSLQRLGT